MLFVLALDRGENINALLSNGLAPIQCAIMLQDQEILELLLALGANVDIKAKDGGTLIFLAAQFGNAAAIPTLYKAGVNANTPMPKRHCPNSLCCAK